MPRQPLRCNTAQRCNKGAGVAEMKKAAGARCALSFPSARRKSFVFAMLVSESTINVSLQFDHYPTLLL